MVAMVDLLFGRSEKYEVVTYPDSISLNAMLWLWLQDVIDSQDSLANMHTVTYLNNDMNASLGLNAWAFQIFGCLKPRCLVVPPLLGLATQCPASMLSDTGLASS